MDVRKLPKISVDPIMGIYYLIYRGEVVYVGQSKDICARIQSHRSDKIFDSYRYRECKEHQMNYMEKKAIIKYRPKFNIAFKPVKSYLPEILSTETFETFFRTIPQMSARIYDEYFVAKIGNGDLVYSKILRKKLKNGSFRFILTDLKSEVSSRGSAMFSTASGYFKYRNRTYYFNPDKGWFKLSVLYDQKERVPIGQTQFF